MESSTSETISAEIQGSRLSKGASRPKEAIGQNGTGDSSAGNTSQIYFTVKEAAEVSRLGASTIRLYIRQRKLEACKIGRRVIIKKSNLEKFLEANSIGPIEDRPSHLT